MPGHFVVVYFLVETLQGEEKERRESGVSQYILARSSFCHQKWRIKRIIQHMHASNVDLEISALQDMRRKKKKAESIPLSHCGRKDIDDSSSSLAEDIEMGAC